MRLLCFILASIAATVMAECDPSDCCYKSERTCESHGRGGVYCAQMLPCSEEVLSTCDADCCGTLRGVNYGWGVPC
ncbi:hypothetical protein AA0114_g10620 [Alternaria tenuissima]|uniref:Uncharacterized protein n=1 Tax=Alternaria tenuissima TaxID=119927 RepID=A0A4Q4M3S8_9PLEO|nr:hypothetical protein AA0114_g10620 [Alternaria tenuissima]